MFVVQCVLFGMKVLKCDVYFTRAYEPKAHGNVTQATKLYTHEKLEL